jgi:hypothetical protein
MDLISNIFGHSSNNSPNEENNENFLLNKLMDIILSYSKEYHVKQFDPFIIRVKKTINFNNYGMSYHKIKRYKEF